MIEHMESDDKPVFFNNRSIAEKLGVSHESRIVGKMLGNLKTKGYITREEKEITFKNKNGTERKELRWCFNTVKNAVVTQCEDDAPMAPEIPPPVVAEIPPPPVPEIPPYNKPLNLDPLNTTTTCSSSFSSFENKCLEYKHSTDDRTPDEFIEHMRHHVKFNSDPESGDYQRKQMILKLLLKLQSNAEHFKSKGYVSTTEKVKKQGMDVLKKMERLRNQWLNYFNSPIEQDCRSKGYESKTFEQWIESNVSS